MSTRRPARRCCGSPAPSTREAGTPILLVGDGHTSQRVAPLPDPASRGVSSGTRAFPVRSSLLSGRVAFALEAPGGVVDLPAPSGARVAAPRRGAAFHDAAARERARADRLTAEVAALSRGHEEFDALAKVAEERRAAIAVLEARLAELAQRPAALVELEERLQDLELIAQEALAERAQIEDDLDLARRAQARPRASFKLQSLALLVALLVFLVVVVVVVSVVAR